MSPAPTYSLPTIGQDNSTEDPKIRTALSDLKTLLTDGLNDSNMATSGIGDGSLASPNNSVYRTLTSIPTCYFGGATSGGVHLVALSTSGGTVARLVGDSTAANTNAPQGVIYFDDADFTVGSLLPKLRIRQQVFVGSTSPSTVTLNCGLYPVSISAGAWNLGTVISSSQTSTTGLTTNTISSFATSDFSIPADGVYCLAIVVGSITCPAGIHVAAQLQTRNT